MLRRLSLLIVLGAVACAAVAATSSGVKSASARAALKKYDVAIARAGEEHASAIRAARKEAVEDLTIAMKNSTRAADLNEANAIHDAIAELNSDVPVAATPAGSKMPTGLWHVVFTSGAQRDYQFRSDGTLAWADKKGKVVVKKGEVLIDDGDGAVERWTTIGDRAFLKHFHPASRFGKEFAAVMGVATPGQEKEKN